MATTKMVNDDDRKDRFCFACESETLGFNPSNWCPRCKWMIRPHCSGFIPLNKFSDTDIESVNEILKNNSIRATVSRLRDWHSRLDRQDSDWLFRVQQSHIEPIIDDEKGTEIRERILQEISEAENPSHKEWLMNRGIPLPGGCWIQISSPSHMPHSITIDGVINSGPRFPSIQLIEMISKMEVWELKAINWNKFGQLLAQLGEDRRDWLRKYRRRGVDWRDYAGLRRQATPPVRTGGSVISQIIRRWTRYRDPEWKWTDLRRHSTHTQDQIRQSQHTSDMEELPFLIERMFSEEAETIPWLNRWREQTGNFSSPDLFDHEYNNCITVRDGRLFVRAKSVDGRIKLRRVPTDFRLWSALISAQLSPPGSTIHDSLQLLLLNWNNDRVTPIMPVEADRRAARLLADLEHKNENIYFSVKDRSLLIEGTTETQYQIKVSQQFTRRLDKYQLSARVDPSKEWEPICTHASEQLRNLPIGDQIVTVALVCAQDKHNHRAIRTVHDFLARKNKITWDDRLASQENLERIDPDEVRVRRRWQHLQYRQREARERAEIVVQNHIVQNPPFPIDDDAIGVEGNRNRIPNLLINALVGLHAAPIGSMARFPNAPGRSFRLLTIENVYQTQQEVEILQTMARNHGWRHSEEMGEHHEVEEGQEIWVKGQHVPLNRDALFEYLTPIQEEFDPEGRQWWARIEDQVRFFRQRRHRAFWNFQNEER